MILLNELKRILTKLPVLVLIIFIVPIFAVSSVAVGIKQSVPPPVSIGNEEFTAVKLRFDNLEKIISSSDYDFTKALRKSFDDFWLSYNEFFTFELDPSIPEANLSQFQNKFDILNENYKAFNNHFYEVFAGTAQVLITQSSYDTLRNWMDDTAKYIEFDEMFDVSGLDEEQLYAKRLGLGPDAWDKYAHPSGELEKHEIYKIITNSKAITFTQEQISKLQNIYDNEIMPNFPQIEYRAEWAAYTETACEYLELNIMLIQSKNTKNITRFQGYKNFNQAAARDRLAVLGVMVTQGKTVADYSAPYQYGKVLNKGTGTTTNDFVFNNLELITIPLIIFSCLIVVFCIFDDIKKNTVISSLVSPQSRRKIIIAKLLACAVAIAMMITVFALLFGTSALLMTGGAAAPAVLTAFGGKALMISPFLLLLVYLISLFFKILFFASVTALFCINSGSLKEALLKPAVLVAFIIVLNIVFTVAFPLTFYQYLPFTSLDFAGFFGIKYMLSRHLASVYFWYTFPVMLALWITLIIGITAKFEKKDF